MKDELICSLLAEIVSAHISRTPVVTEELPNVIRTVYDALVTLEAQPQTMREARQPAIAFNAAIRHDTIACLECGKRMMVLKRHLSADHGLTGPEYKLRWQLPADYPLVAPEYAQRRQILARTIGLGVKHKASAPRPARRNSREKP